MFKVTRYRINSDKCIGCGFCRDVVECPGYGECVGCSSCFLACPNYAIEPYTALVKETVRIMVDGEEYDVPRGITVKKALEILGFSFSRYPLEDSIFAPCETGGCWACAVIINGELRPSCHTAVRNGMEIETTSIEEKTPMRVVGGFTPHPVGGVGTPHWLKGKGHYIEVACFTAGCNYRCPSCQNYDITYNSRLPPMTPREAACELTYYRRLYGVDRLAISGGEPTLNRRWLIKFFEELRKLNKDEKARLHLDTNASILTPDYIDELIEAGVTDIGPDLKALRIDTFMKITGLNDRELAEKYLKTSWNAVKYIIDNYYPEKVFLGIGIPYNKFFHPTLDEIYEIGYKIASMDPNVQVCVLDYRPEFRRINIRTPSVDEMLEVKKALEDTGLKTVIVQTSIGHIGP